MVSTKILKELSYPKWMTRRAKLVSFNVPDGWKKAVFKKGDKENSGNYRTIRLTSQVCKIFECMLRDSIVDHSK